MKQKFIQISKANRLKQFFSWKNLRKTKLKSLLLKSGIGLLTIIVLMFLWFSKDLPTPARIAKKINTPSTQILDRNGDLLYAVSQNKKRFVIPLSDMPDSIKNATIALEDICRAPAYRKVELQIFFLFCETA